MDLLLKEKLALVSGSTAGIGLAIAEGLARESATVIVNGRSEPRVANAIEMIRQKYPGSQVEGFAGDLSTVEGFDLLKNEYPDVDIPVNNLGIFNPQPFEEISDEEWRRFFEVNVLSGVRLSRYYLPRMKDKGWGRIVFISSESAIQIPVEMIHYGCTKTAQLAISRGLAESTVGTGVTVNAVLPGPTASEGVRKVFFRKSASDEPLEAVRDTRGSCKSGRLHLQPVSVGNERCFITSRRWSRSNNRLSCPAELKAPASPFTGNSAQEISASWFISTVCRTLRTTASITSTKRTVRRSQLNSFLIGISGVPVLGSPRRKTRSLVRFLSWNDRTIRLNSACFLLTDPSAALAWAGGLSKNQFVTAVRADSIWSISARWMAWIARSRSTSLSGLPGLQKDLSKSGGRPVSKSASIWI